MLNKIYQRIRTSTDTLEIFPSHVLWEDKELVSRLKEQGVSYATLRYLSLIDDTKDKTIFFAWNWAAFFFGPLWAIYRKNYIGALIMWGLSALLSIGGIVGTVFASFLIGIFSDSLYFYFLRKSFYTKNNLHPSWVGVAIVGLLIPALVTLSTLII